MSTKKFEPGKKVILAEVPDELLAGLPIEDQRAITSFIGKPVLFVGYDEDGRAEVEFTDDSDVIHSIFLDAKFLNSSIKISAPDGGQTRSLKGLTPGLLCFD